MGLAALPSNPVLGCPGSEPVSAGISHLICVMLKHKPYEVGTMLCFVQPGQCVEGVCWILLGPVNVRGNCSWLEQATEGRAV